MYTQKLEDLMNVQYYSLDGASQYLGVSKSEFQKICRKYKVPYFQIHNRHCKRYEQKVLDKLKNLITK